MIDDNAMDRKKNVTILEKEGCSVMEASNVDEVMLKAQQTPPDLVVVDAVKDDSNTIGFDICREIKTTFQPNSPLVPVVTGNIQGINVSLANKMGADNFAVKTSEMAAS